jgi:hypothetical protein
MNDFAAAFRDISSFYQKLAGNLTKILNSDDSIDSRTLVNSLLQNREYLEQISQLNSRITKLTDDWTQCRQHLPADARNEADDMVAAARAHAVRLEELCRMHIQKLQPIRDELRNNLVELAKGARLAKGLRPSRNNYPKFIDSSY